MIRTKHFAFLGKTFVGYCNFFCPLLTFPVLNVRRESFPLYDMSAKLNSTFKACKIFWFPLSLVLMSHVLLHQKVKV